MEEEFKRFIIMTIKFNGNNEDELNYNQREMIKNIPKVFFYDEEILINLLRHIQGSIDYIPLQFWDDEQFILKLIKRAYPSYFHKISHRLLTDREFNLKLTKIYPYCFKFLYKEFQEDEEFVLNCPMILEYAIKFQNNKKIAMIAIKKDIECAKYVSDELINNKEILYTIFKKDFYEFDLNNKIKDKKLKNEFINNYFFTRHTRFFKNWESYGKKKILDYLYIYVGHEIKFYNENFDINFIYSNDKKRKFNG